MVKKRSGKKEKSLNLWNFLVNMSGHFWQFYHVFLYLTLQSVFKRVFLCVQFEQCFLVFSLLYQLLLKITYCIAYGFYIIWTLTYEAQSLYFHVKHFQSCSANHKSSQSKAFYSIYTILLLEKPIKPTDTPYMKKLIW